MNTIHDLLLRARTIVELCAIKNPKFKYEGVLQDPYGAHQLLLEINDALKARVAELEKDAARWKWMRANWFNFGVMSNINTPFGHAAHNIAMAGDEQTLDVAVDAAIAASKEAPNQTLPQVAGTVPRRARKIGGSYQANGTVVAQFKTLGGADRVVFEFDEPAGMLHIFASEQVELREIES